MSHKMQHRHMIPMPERPDHFERSERAKDSSPQDWFENSEGLYSGQTGQFIPKEKLNGFGYPQVSILQPGEVKELEDKD